MKKKIGIYKILAPSGKIYIGQSWDIERRLRNYKKYNCPLQRHLHNSFLKYGGDMHVFEFIHELPSDIEQSVMDNYEQLYMDLYRYCGITLLNLKEAGQRGRLSDESRKKLSQTKKGIDSLTPEARKRQAASMKGKPSPRKGCKLTDEQKLHLSKLNKGKLLPESAKLKLKGRLVWNKGLTGVDNNWAGRKHSTESKEKLRQINTGKKLSPETIAKRTATLKINGVKRRWSDEAKKRQSEKYLGKTKSAETIEKGRATRLLKKLNQSHAI